jgi:hypothetical protein
LFGAKYWTLLLCQQAPTKSNSKNQLPQSEKLAAGWPARIDPPGESRRPRAVALMQRGRPQAASGMLMSKKSVTT